MKKNVKQVMKKFQTVELKKEQTKKVKGGTIIIVDLIES